MPSASNDEFSSQIERYGYTTLSCFAQRPGNIDVSPVGHLVLQSQDTLHVLLPNLGFTTLLKSADTIKSHHEESQDIPVFNYPISITSIPSDTSKAGSHKDAYMIAYEAHFVDAKWSPNLLGPFESPLLAALTTQSQIVLFCADSNQFLGPWKQFSCQDGGVEHHILSMTWIEAGPDRAWLLAGTKRGKVIAWNVGSNSNMPLQEPYVFDGEIIGLCWSKSKYLAVFSTEGIFIAEVARSGNNLEMRSMSIRPDLRRRAHVNLACWKEDELVYCTAGQVHLFDAVNGRQGSVLLEQGEEDESCSMRPAIALNPLQGDSWRVTVQDGTEYIVSSDILYGPTEFITPRSHVPPANEAIGAMQRTVEAVRGLYARVEDEAGLTFTCHDANSIASWAFFRDPKCQFGLSLTQSPVAAQEVAMASRMIDAALHGDYVCLRALIVFYMRSSKKEEIMALVMHALQHQVQERSLLKAAIRLSVWVQKEQAREGKQKASNAIHDTLREIGVAASLLKAIMPLQAQLTTQKVDSGDASFCLILSAAAVFLGEIASNVELVSAGQRISKSLGNNLPSVGSGPIDAGEKCPACASQVFFSKDFINYAKCQKGHLWKRCSSTFVLLTTSLNRVCSICSQESIRPEDAQGPMQRQLLQSMTACDLCGGKLFLHV